MKLLIITQKVDRNDPILGFFHRWIEEFAKHCEQIIVICLQKGEFALPANVRVLSLGKEEGKSRLKYLWRFYKYIWQERKNYDKVFVHMNQEYILLGGCVWRFLGKKNSLWYAHGQASFRLRLAEKLTHLIFTSTASGCRLLSQKIKIVGQGIDINAFSPRLDGQDREGFTIISVGRISPVKDYETLIKATALVLKSYRKIQVQIVGAIGLAEQEQYFTKLKLLSQQFCLSDIVKFVGPRPNIELVKLLRQADILVNTSRTGSLDKAVLEAMASGLPVLSCNDALNEVLAKYRCQLLFSIGDEVMLAKKILDLIVMGSVQRAKLGKRLREIVVTNHNLRQLIRRIITQI